MIQIHDLVRLREVEHNVESADGFLPRDLKRSRCRRVAFADGWILRPGPAAGQIFGGVVVFDENMHHPPA